MTRTLIAYASKHGSTEEVARAIATRLREAGHDVDIRDAAVVSDVDRYDLVIVGGSLYMSRWHADARKFLRRHAAALEGRPLAVFALGPLTTEEHQLADSHKQLTKALTHLDVHPSLVTVFGGVVDPDKLRFPFNHMPQTDARVWPEIEAWATEVGSRVFDSLLAKPV
jgi:menaquinone-dependent protoporphyrinogen oxidase